MKTNFDGAAQYMHSDGERYLHFNLFLINESIQEKTVCYYQMSWRQHTMRQKSYKGII